jgi:hypothetical protein
MRLGMIKYLENKFDNRFLEEKEKILINKFLTLKILMFEIIKLILMIFFLLFFLKLLKLTL